LHRRAGGEQRRERRCAMPGRFHPGLDVRIAAMFKAYFR
jgi:hypothetical protein